MQPESLLSNGSLSTYRKEKTLNCCKARWSGFVFVLAKNETQAILGCHAYKVYPQPKPHSLFP